MSCKTTPRRTVRWLSADPVGELIDGRAVGLLVTVGGDVTQYAVECLGEEGWAVRKPLATGEFVEYRFDPELLGCQCCTDSECVLRLALTAALKSAQRSAQWAA